MSTLKVGDIKHESFTGTTQLKLDSAGRVLIGTSTDNGFKFKVSDGGGYEFAFAPNDSGVNSLINYNRSGSAYVPFMVSGSDLRFGSGGNSERMRIDSSGRVGIGDTSPDRELVVKNASSNATVKIEASNAHTSQLFFSDTDAENVARISVFHGAGQATSNSMLFDLGGTTRMAINSSGNVGIGMTTIGSALDVNGASGDTLRLSNGSAAAAYKIGRNSVDGKLEFRGTQSGDEVYSFGGVSGEKIRFQSGGGISFNGDTATANALDDYEEGTWQPTANGSNLSVTSGGCIYVKIGKLVLLIFDFTQNSGSAATSIGGLPYAVAKHSTFNLGYVTNSGGSGQGSTDTTGGRIDSPANTLIFAVAGGTNNPTLVNGQRIIGSGSYITT